MNPGNNTGLLPYICARLEEEQLRHEVHHFPSGAIMVDIWIGSRFYVLQLDDATLGLSEVTDDSAWFDVIPDRNFKQQTDFTSAFEALLRGKGK